MALFNLSQRSINFLRIVFVGFGQPGSETSYAVNDNQGWGVHFPVQTRISPQSRKLSGYHGVDAFRKGKPTTMGERINAALSRLRPAGSSRFAWLLLSFSERGPARVCH